MLKKPIYIEGLDLIRFAAAASVVCFHIFYFGWAAKLPTVRHYPVVAGGAWASCGWVGVETFFVISGLVIAMSADGASPFGFLRSRVARLGPGLWCCATITLALLLVTAGGGLHLLSIYARSLVLFPIPPWIEGVYWTLVVEEVFYLYILLLLATNQFKNIGVIASVFGVLCALAWYVMPSHMHSTLTRTILVRHGCFFAVGILIWLMIFKNFRWSQAAACVLCCLGCLREISVESHLKDVSTDVAGSAMTAQAVWLLSLALVITVCLIAARGVRLPFAGALKVIGLLTYPLYLIHQTVSEVIVSRLWAWSPPLALLIGIGSALAIAGFVSRWVEPVGARLVKAGFDRLKGSGGQFTTPLFRGTTPVSDAAPAKT